MARPLKLTALSACAGCAAKLGQDALAQVLRRLPSIDDPNLLVGSATADDAAVYRIGRDRALVQTVDFFTPIVDAPFSYGQIAAANAISDVYAMGGRPLTALNILGIPADLVPPEAIAAILRGGASKAKAAGCTLVGGHSIRVPEPIYGLAVTGIVAPSRMMTNAKARPGDHLVLTKPLGTGIVTTAIKRGLASPALAGKTIALMGRLNTAGASLAERRLVCAGVDVTGFGLLGHLGSMCRASGVGAVLSVGALPVIAREVWALIARDCIPGGSRTNLETAMAITDFGSSSKEQRALLSDAQTSGGLLLCVPPARLGAVLELLRLERTACAAVIGGIVRARPPRITISP
jgi:selenide,water dikinase